MNLDKQKTLSKGVKNLIESISDFGDSMLHKFLAQYPEKGLDFRNIEKEYLVDRLKEHINAENWVDVANYAFLLKELC